MITEIPSLRRLLLLILFQLTILSMQAQRSYRYENFGNRSVLLNGNVTGSVNDLGGVFYNPARLAIIENPKFSVEGRFYERTEVNVNDFLGAGINIENKQFNALPGLMAAATSIGSEKIYFSFMLRNRINISSSFDSGILDENNTDNIAPGILFNADAAIDINLREEWFGLSWAKKISDNFSVGISTFLSFYNYSGGDSFDFIISENDQNLLQFNGDLKYTQASTGLFGKVSAAWQQKHLSMGLTIDLPYIELRDDSSFNSKDFFTDRVTNEDIFTINQFSGLVARRKVPLGINFGAGIPIGKSTLHLNTDWHAGVGSYDRIEIPPLESTTEPTTLIEAKEKLNPVWNIGAGAEIFISEKINTYLSFTTDHSPLNPEDTFLNGGNNFGESNILTLDYLHLGGGVGLTFKSFAITLGAVNTSGSGDFERSITLPVGVDNFDDTDLNIKVDRWRFLVGFNFSGFGL
ncbi:hypothetical protein E7Z59_14105 [Robertkochia marina]|uniref:Aromatic hydrocarbon degradation protein n=1 Tax=Robertkochia marina TaxID=1227945 RepID=A0A4S3LY61_9FLAO|nr:hypothetical protein [Robertkochia marina]THD65717.1 hypothetical protein E7Z59_14105 [Robertkochia marina]